MITLILIMVAIFILVSIVPIIQWIYYSKECKEQFTIGYLFEKELFESNLNESRTENITNGTLSIAKFKDRGSVRIAQGLVFDNNEFEERKKAEYAIELP